MAQNINIIQIQNMINSSVEQGNIGEQSKVILTEGQTGLINEFLDSIDDRVDLLKIKKALIDGKANAKNLIQIYHKSLLVELSTYRINLFKGLNVNGSLWGDEICNSVREMLVLRNKIIDLYISIYEIDPNVVELPYLLNELLKFNFNDCEADENSSAYLIYDNYRVILNEIFSHLIAYLLREQMYSCIEQLIKFNYQVKCIYHSSSSKPFSQFFSVTFNRFNDTPYTIDFPLRRQINGCYDESQRLYRDFLHTRIYNEVITKDEIEQADTLLYYLSLIYRSEDAYHFWVPNYYSSSFYSLEIMLRSSSVSFFEKIKGMFNADSFEELQKNFIGFRKHLEENQWLIRFGYVHSNILDVFNWHNLFNQK